MGPGPLTNQLYLLAMPAFGGEAPKVSVHEPTVPLKKLTDIGADYAAWADGGKTIIWAVGASVFRLPFDSVVFTSLKTEEVEKDEESREGREGAGEAQTRGDRRRRRAAEAPPRGTIVLRGAQGRHHARRRGDRRRRSS